MLVLSWLLFIHFGLCWLGSTSINNKSRTQKLLWHFEAIMVAIAAATIWGGLFQ